MSKKSKSESKLRRRSLKAGQKAAEKAKYAKWTADGQNSSKRSKLRSKRSKGNVRAKRHKDGPCGNIGCAIDNPMDYNLLSPAQLAHKH